MSNNAIYKIRNKNTGQYAGNYSRWTSRVGKAWTKECYVLAKIARMICNPEEIEVVIFREAAVVDPKNLRRGNEEKLIKKLHRLENKALGYVNAVSTLKMELSKRGINV